MTFSFLSLLLSVPAQAVPLQLNQQGRLLDDNGEGLSGSNQMIFKIYDSEEGGDILWSDTLTSEFRNGYYSVLLGTDDENNPLDSTVLEQYPLYLELTLNGEVLSPRHALSSVPYAQIAGVAESVDFANVENMPEDILDGDSDILGDLACAQGELVSWDGNSWVCVSDSNLTYSDIENYLLNNPIALNPSTTINGNIIITNGSDSDSLGALSCQDGEIARFDQSTNAWFCDVDLDTDTVLGQSDVVNYVNGSQLNLGSGSQVDGANIVSQPSVCNDGDVLLYDAANNGWICGVDTDTTLTPTEVQSMVELMSLNLQNLPQVNGDDVLTVNSTIDPTKVDTSNASDGQVLSVNSGVASWEDNGNASGCSLVDEVKNKKTLDCNGTIFTTPTLLTAIQQLESGHSTPCVLDSMGFITCWGDDTSNLVSDTPTGTFTSMNGKCALDSTGLITCWGSDSQGQVTNVPSGTYSSLSRDNSGGSPCALDSAGSITCWGSDFQGQVSDVPNGSFTTVSGNASKCALDNAGYLSCWGDDSFGVIGERPNGSFIEVSVGALHACALDGIGSITCWGTDNYGQVSGVPTGSFTAISSGHYNSCALDSAGSITCWGGDYHGQVSDIPTNTTFKEVSAGAYSICALTNYGVVSCWGKDSAGQVSNSP